MQNWLIFLGPNIKMCVFGVMGLKIFDRVGTNILILDNLFLEKCIILCILKGILPFKMHKIIFFFQKN